MPPVTIWVKKSLHTFVRLVLSHFSTFFFVFSRVKFYHLPDGAVAKNAIYIQF